MLEIARELLRLLTPTAGPCVAVATTVRVAEGSTTTVGVSMALSARGELVGGLAAGCVEASALARCEQLLRDDAVPRGGVATTGAPVGYGLSCGTEIDVLFHRIGGPALRAELSAAAEGRTARTGVLVAGPPELVGTVVCAGEGAPERGQPDDGVLRRVSGVGVEDLRRTVVGCRATSLVEVAGAPGLRLLAEVRDAAPRFVIVGTGDVTAALAAGAASLGFAVTVVDPRPRFATSERAPAAEEVVAALAHEWLRDAALDGRSVVCVLSHDEDLDPLAVAAALERRVAFVGALGSRATHARRLERLVRLGVPPDAAARVRAPLGLDLGARTPAETALSILAEVVTLARGGTGLALTGGQGPIHRFGT